MLKNQKWTILLVILAVISIAVSGFFIWKLLVKKDTQTASNTSASEVVALNGTRNDESISLTPKKNESNGGLSVDDSQSSSANLGSGTSRQISSSSSSSSQQDDFSQYEQYKDKNEVYFGDIVVGTGTQAVKDSQLAVTYKGYLTSGQVFDQSKPANNGQLQPLLFTLGSGQLIPGFEQGVAGMKVGGTRRVIIPPSLGYGATEQNGIPANSVLIFDIQLTAAQ
jgi:FKBP-type peptidyl-prolyl cis-trans isomerase